MDLGNIDWEKVLGIVLPQEGEYESVELDYTEKKPVLARHAQKLRIRMERKGRGGKVVTVVSGFVGETAELQSLAAALKTALGLGGSAKDGLILLQGNCRERVVDWLKAQGYSNVK